MKTVLLLAVLVVLFTVGCNTSSASRIVAPDGRAAVVVECSSVKGCYEKVSIMCPSGYDLLDQSAEDGVEVRGFRNQQVGFVTAKNTHKSTFVVACKGGAEPVNLNDACLKEPISRSSGELGANCDDRRFH